MVRKGIHPNVVPQVNASKTRNLIPFKKGNPGGPGRPRGSYKHLFKDVPDTDGPAIVASLVKSAKKGSVTAAKFLVEQCDGLPVQPVAHSGNVQVRVVHVGRAD